MDRSAAGELTEPQTAAVAAIKLRLLVDSVTTEACSRLREAGVQTLLLKGPAIADWLYDRGEGRLYGDTDLLVSPIELERAAEVLRELGFKPVRDERVLAPFAEPHAVVLSRESDGAEIDLHYRIPGIQQDPVSVWAHLYERRERLQLKGGSVDVLSIEARTMHVALHAVQDPFGEQPAADLARSLNRLSLEDWHAATHLAHRVHAIEPFSAALRKSTDGARLADTLRLPGELSAHWALWQKPHLLAPFDSTLCSTLQRRSRHYR